MSNCPSSRPLSYSPVVWGTIIFAATFLAFADALTNEFVNWDDHIFLINNPNFRGFSPAHLSWMFSTVMSGPYQPLSWLSYALDYAIWGMTPFGFHLSNVIIHSVNGALFFAVSRLILGRVFHTEAEGNKISLLAASAVSALLFAVHPLRVESVAWASERRDVLSGLFYLLTVWVYLKGVAARGRTGLLGSRWQMAAVGAFFLALLSKATTVGLPLALIFLDVYPLRRLEGPVSRWFKDEGNRRVLMEKIPFFFLSLLFGVIAVYGQSGTVGAKIYESSPWFRWLAPSYSLAFYLWKFVFPWPLLPLYELPESIEEIRWALYGATIFCAALTAAVIAVRRRPQWLLAWAGYAVVVLPVSGLFQFGRQITADRYTYLAFLGLSLIAGAGMLKGLRGLKSWAGRGLVVGGSVAVLAVFFLETRAQTKRWENGVTLWKYTLHHVPESEHAYDLLGTTYFNTGRYNDALKAFQKAVEIHPKNGDFISKVASAQYRTGQKTEGLKNFEKVLAMNSHSFSALAQLGYEALAKGEKEKAVAYFKKSLEADNNDGSAYYSMGQELVTLGDWKGAVPFFEMAVRTTPIYPKAHLMLGLLLADEGKIDEGFNEVKEAARQDPEFADAQYHLGLFYGREGNSREALRRFRLALRLDPNHPDAPGFLKKLLELNPGLEE